MRESSKLKEEFLRKGKVAFCPIIDAHANRCVILTHTWGNDPYCGPKLIDKIANKYPGITFLMGQGEIF